jgi:hypothetical protein
MCAVRGALPIFTLERSAGNTYSWVPLSAMAFLNSVAACMLRGTRQERNRTSGVGTFQFGRDTKAAIETYLSSTTNGRRVNNVFGEGTSPKLRSLRDGLNALGMSSDEMLKHGMEKVVYGAALVSNSARYLLRLDDMPHYLFSLDEAQASTARIAQHWFERWASARMERSETEQKLLAHTLVRPVRHGARVLLPSDDADQLSFRID